MRRRIAFYAPLKPPDDPTPSGDRQIARLVMSALERAGHDVELASRFISYQKRPSAPAHREKAAAGQAEADLLLRRFRARPARERPHLWLTYHPYCKAPDWLGPRIARELAIPYLTVEACRTRQNSDADWAEGRHAVQAAIRQAAVNFCLKPSDRDYLAEVLPSEATICPLAPFLDLAALPPLPPSPSGPRPTPVIVAAGMMRPGKKEMCYHLLAEALGRLDAQPWRLVLIGDGPARPAIERSFAGFRPDRLHWTGAIDHAEVIAWFDRADIFAWPGYREPIGMVYLEAASRRLPVAAFASLGVPMVVRDGSTGLLAPEGDVDAYAEAIGRLLADAPLRRRLGQAGRAMVEAEHDIPAASATLESAIGSLFPEERPERAG